MTYSRIFAFFMTCLSMGSYAHSAFADEIKIIQKDKKFYVQEAGGTLKQVKKLDIKKGDKLNFVNDDKIAHNIYAKGDVADFEIAKQEPGSTNSHIFDKAGQAKVRCAIHPRMKIKLNIQE